MPQRNVPRFRVASAQLRPERPAVVLTRGERHHAPHAVAEESRRRAPLSAGYTSRNMRNYPNYQNGCFRQQAKSSKNRQNPKKTGNMQYERLFLVDPAPIGERGAEQQPDYRRACAA